MMNYNTLHLIIGKWRTPNHSGRKELDDSHEVKGEILKRVGKKNFLKKVGANPDIDITSTGTIILRGVGEYKRRPYYVTELSADDYFILKFIAIKQSNETEVQILILNSSDSEDGMALNLISHMHQLFIIPNNDTLIIALINSLTEDYLERESDQNEDYIVLLQK